MLRCHVRLPRKSTEEWFFPVPITCLDPKRRPQFPGEDSWLGRGGEVPERIEVRAGGFEGGDAGDFVGLLGVYAGFGRHEVPEVVIVEDGVGQDVVHGEIARPELGV